MMNFFEENEVNMYRADDFKELVIKCFSKENDNNSSNSYFLVDFGRIVKSVREWFNLLPRIKLLQKAGASADKVILQFLSSLGIKLTVNTGVELDRIVKKGILPKDILYTGLCKINRHIKIAANYNIMTLTISSLKELERVVCLYPDANLSIRICEYGQYNQDISIYECIRNKLYNLNTIFKRAKELGVEIKGLQFDFLATEVNFSESDCLMKMEMLLDFAIKSNIGLSFINLGTGQWIENLSRVEYSGFCNNLNRLTLKYNSLVFYAEPNQFVLGTSGLVCCSVVGVKEIWNDDKSQIFYYLNDGVYGSFSKSVFSGLQVRPSFYKREVGYSEDNSRATFWGPTCDSMDKICVLEDCPMLSIGDVLVFDAMGCQSIAAATNFNGFDLPSPIYAFCLENLVDLDYLCLSEIQQKY